jgi:hypothetical protein
VEQLLGEHQLRVAHREAHARGRGRLALGARWWWWEGGRGRWGAKTRGAM